MPSGGQVEIDVSLDSTRAMSQLGTLQNQVQGISWQGIKNGDIASQQLASSLQTAGQMLTLGLTVPLVAATAASVKYSITVESAMTSVRKTVDETANTSYADLKQAAIDMSETKFISQDQILDVMALGGQLGISADALSEFSSVIADIDVSTNLDSETAATELAQLANITGMTTDEYSRFGATLIELGNNCATTESDIMSMAMRIAGSASQVGMGEDQILALSASLSSVGINAESGGSSISQIITQIDKDIALGTDNMQTWADTAGMSVDSFKSAWENDAAGALQSVLVGMSDASAGGENLNLILDDLGISSIRQSDALKRLSGNADGMSNTFDMAASAWQENTALSEEAGKQYDSTAARIQQLKSKVMNTAEVFGNTFKPVINGLIDTLGGLFDGIGKVLEVLSGAPTPIKAVVFAVLALVAAFGPALMIAGSLMSTIANLSKGFEVLKATKAAATAATAANTAATTANKAAQGGLVSSVSKAIGKVLALAAAHKAQAAAALGALGVIGLLVAGIVALAKSDMSADEMAAKVTEMADNLSSAVTSFADGLPQMIESVIPAVVGAISSIANAIPQVVTSIVGAISTALPAIIQAGISLITGLVTAITTVIPAVISGIVSLVMAVISVLPTLIPQLLQAAVTLLMAIVQALPQVIIALVTALPQIITAIVAMLPTLIPQLLMAAIQLFMAFVQAIPQIIVAVVGAIPQIIVAVVQMLPTLIPALISGAVQLFMGIVMAIPQIIGALLGAIGDLIGQAVEALPGFIGDMLSSAGELFMSIADGVGSVVGDVLSAVGDLLSQIPGAISGFAGDLFTAAGDMMQGMLDGITGAAGMVWDKITEVCSGALDAVKGFFGIASPSKVFRQIFGYLMEGAAIGIEDRAGLVYDSLGNVVDNVYGIASDANPLIKVGMESIDWNATDGVFDTQSAINPSLQQIGSTESKQDGSSAEKFMTASEMKQAIESAIATAVPKVMVLLDKRTMVGQLSSGIDGSIGSSQVLAGRGAVV